MWRPRLSEAVALVTSVVAYATISGCTCSSSETGLATKDGGVTGMPTGLPVFNPEEGGNHGLNIIPDSPSLDVNPANPEPATLAFQVTGATTSQVTWSVSNPGLGTIDSNGVFTASGKSAGTTTIRATIGDVVVSVTLTVNVAHAQNGRGAGDELDAGVGGLGGVGGEGFGVAVPDDLVKILTGSPGT
ncbi:MAG TPA: Ig-like domain-containing protein, partial [Polyangiaceae bacterium]